MSRILGEGERITRKVHTCCVCGELIPKGTLACWQTNTGGEMESGDYADFGTAYWHKGLCPVIERDMNQKPDEMPY